MADEEGVWRTIRGRRVFIADGQSLTDAMKKSGKFKGSVSDIIKQQRTKKNSRSIEELKEAKFDADTKKLILKDGTEIGLLDKKEYKKLCEQQFGQASEDTKAIVNSYTESQATAGSAELNAITEEKLKNHNGGLRRYRVCYDEKLLCTKRESDMQKEKAYKDWVDNFKPQIGDKHEYDLRREWQKKWNYDYDEHPSDYYHEQRLKDGLWNNDEIAEAKSIYPKLQKLEDDRYAITSKYTYYDKEYQTAEDNYKKGREEVLKTIKNERLAVENRSAYWYSTIAKYDETKIYRPDVNIEEEIKKGTIKNMTTKDLADLDYTPALKKMQPTDIDSSITSLKHSMGMFDTAFEKDGIVLDKDILVYRRGRESYDEVNSKDGFTKYGYISTSAQDTLPKKMPSGVRFGEQSYYIYVPKGTKVLFAENIIGYDTPETRVDRIQAEKGLKRQHEIILPRNSHFTKVSYDYNTQSYILKMEVEKDGK